MKGNHVREDGPKSCLTKEFLTNSNDSSPLFILEILIVFKAVRCVTLELLMLL